MRKLLNRPMAFLACGVILGALSLYGLTGRSHAAARQQWEYQFFPIVNNWSDGRPGNPDEPAVTLNRLGADGWEVVEILDPYGNNSNGYYALFKRPK